MIGGDYSGSTGKTGLTDAKRGKTCFSFIFVYIYLSGMVERVTVVGRREEEFSENLLPIIKFIYAGV